MAVTRTERFALHRWDSGSDSFNREQNDTDNRQVEALAAVFRSGLDAGKGDPTEDSFIRSFYYATDTELLYFCNGTVWVTLNSYSTSTNIADLPVGTANSPGGITTSGSVKTIKYALADHAHGVPDSAAPVAIGTSNLEGTASTIALSDHVHEIGSEAIDGSGMFTAGVVNATAIGTGAVVEAKIGVGAVTETKIGSIAVTETKIATGAVTETKIATGAVTPLKIASTLAGDGLGRNVSTGILNVNVDGTTIETSGDALQVKNGGITTDKIGALQVTGAKIAEATITADKFYPGAVSGASLDNGAVIEQKIATGAVTETKIATGAVTPLKIASTLAGDGLGRNVSTGILNVNVDGTTIETSGDALQVKNGGVTAVKLNSNVAGTGLTSASGVLSVNVDNSTVEISSGNIRIKNLGVTEGKINTGAVTEGKIGSNAVTAAKLHSGIAGTGINFASGVLSVKVDGTTIEHNGSGNLQIVANSVDTAQIKDDAVDYTKIDTGIYYNATTLGAGGAIKYSLSSPTGGSAGDIWLQYV
jgi:hypothetical protein